jgi:hypothetical protein
VTWNGLEKVVDVPVLPSKAPVTPAPARVETTFDASVRTRKPPVSAMKSVSVTVL